MSSQQTYMISQHTNLTRQRKDIIDQHNYQQGNNGITMEIPLKLKFAGILLIHIPVYLLCKYLFISIDNFLYVWG